MPTPAAPLPHPIDGDLVAFAVMLSGMAGAGLMTVWAVLCFSGRGPFGATLTLTIWAFRLLRRDPFPLTTTAYWATTTTWFPAWPAVRALISATWLLLVAAGAIAMAVDAVAGPKEQRIFVDQYGRPQRVVRRMKEKRVIPPKMDKAVKAVTPARDRVAYELAARRWAKNEGRAAVGLEPLRDGWVRRKLTAALPTGKTKTPRPPVKERVAARTGARRAARAEVAGAGAGLPAAPPVRLSKQPARPRAGHDPAAPAAAPPRPFGREVVS